MRDLCGKSAAIYRHILPAGLVIYRDLGDYYSVTATASVWHDFSSVLLQTCFPKYHIIVIVNWNNLLNVLHRHGTLSRWKQLHSKTLWATLQSTRLHLTTVVIAVALKLLLITPLFKSMKTSSSPTPKKIVVQCDMQLCIKHNKHNWDAYCHRCIFCCFCWSATPVSVTVCHLSGCAPHFGNHWVILSLTKEYQTSHK